MSIAMMKAGNAVAVVALGLALWQLFRASRATPAPVPARVARTRAAPARASSALLQSVAGEEDPGAALDDWLPAQSGRQVARRLRD